MKKQILILFMVVFVLGANQTFGQTNIYLPPTPLPEICVDLDDPLNVIPGVEYTYSVDVPAPPGDKTYHWFVTQDINFIADGVLTINRIDLDDENNGILASGSDHYDETSANSSIQLTWESFTLDPGDFVFVVIYVENTLPDDGCVTNNLKVYRIQPLHAFTLDIANILPDFTDFTLDDLEQCVDDVQTARFDPDWDDGNGGVVYDYGRNTFFYVVAAANFTHGYQLSYQFEGLQGPTPQGDPGQHATIYYSNTMADLIGDEPTSDGSVTIEADVTGEDGNVLGIILAEDVTVSTDGQMLYIRIDIIHNQFEAADGESIYPYELRLDAVLVDEENIALDPDEYGDLLNIADQIADAEDCGRDPFHNLAIQVLNARPTVESQTGDPVVPFLPNAP